MWWWTRHDVARGATGERRLGRKVAPRGRAELMRDRILLFDVGNTHTHVGVASASRVARHFDVPTCAWREGGAAGRVARRVGKERIVGAAMCSVVPQVTPVIRRFVHEGWALWPRELTAANVQGIGIDYPRPRSIGPDRLANSIAARARFGAPVLTVDFGTAVTFDVVDPRGCYVGGIIAPGLAAMTHYLHEKTALLPRIRIREARRVIGRSTEEAMLAGAVYGYRGLIRTLVLEVKRALGVRRLPVVATGGTARLMARGLPEISAVDPVLTLDGLRLFWWRGRANG
jgi:type III pantothenate kinase